MSDPNFYEDDTDDQGKPEKLRDHEKAQAKRIKELEANEVKAAAAIRRLAFVDAGVDTSTLTAQDFVKAYDGELTPEAIREAATARKLIAETPPDPALAAEGEAQQRINAARTAGESTVAPTDWQAQIDAAQSDTELDAIEARIKAGKSA